MTYDSWLTYTAASRTSGTNNDAYCTAEKESFEDAWVDDDWVTFIRRNQGWGTHWRIP